MQNNIPFEDWMEPGARIKIGDRPGKLVVVNTAVTDAGKIVLSMYATPDGTKFIFPYHPQNITPVIINQQRSSSLTQI